MIRVPAVTAPAGVAVSEYVAPDGGIEVADPGRWKEWVVEVLVGHGDAMTSSPLRIRAAIITTDVARAFAVGVLHACDLADAARKNRKAGE